MTPIRPVGSDTNDLGRLDEVIESIETALPHIHQMCRVHRKQKKSPTDRLSRDTVSRFQELSEDPIVNIDATDIIGPLPLNINGDHNPKNGVTKG